LAHQAKGQDRGVSRGPPGSRLPARHYAICIYSWTSTSCVTDL